MTLNLNKKSKYTSPYYTNWGYLRNLTWLQMKSIEEMTWGDEYKKIHTGLWDVPNAWHIRKYAKDSMRYFISDLNKQIKRL